jgi:hypothetical protein
VLEAVAAVVAVGVAVPTPMTESDDGEKRYEAAAVAVQSAARGRKARKLSRPQLTRREVRELVAVGFRANMEGDWAVARLNFLVAYLRGGGKIENGISAANMALRLGEHDVAVEEYAQLLQQPGLTEYHRRCITSKLQQAQKGASKGGNLISPLLACLGGSAKCLVPLVPKSPSTKAVAFDTEDDDPIDAEGFEEVEATQAPEASAKPERPEGRRGMGVLLALVLLTLLTMFAAALLPEEAAKLQASLARGQAIALNQGQELLFQGQELMSQGLVQGQELLVQGQASLSSRLGFDAAPELPNKRRRGRTSKGK